MPFNGAGSFAPYTPGNPVVSGATISSSAFNNTIQDIATGLSTAITRDGQSPPTADLPMAGHKLTGLAAGSSANDSVRFDQLPTLATLGAAPLASPTFTGVVTSPSFVGPLTGNVTGNVTGNASGTAGNLSGTPALPNGTTASTQALNDSTTKLATTAFVNPASSLSSNGYMKLANGVIIQWGVSTIPAAVTTINMPIAFPSNGFSAMSSIADTTGSYTTAATLPNLSQITLAARTSTTGALASSPVFWQAIGN